MRPMRAKDAYATDAQLETKNTSAPTSLRPLLPLLPCCAAAATVPRSEPRLPPLTPLLSEWVRPMPPLPVALTVESAVERCWGRGERDSPAVSMLGVPDTLCKHRRSWIDVMAQMLAHSCAAQDVLRTPVCAGWRHGHSARELHAATDDAAWIKMHWLHISESSDPFLHRWRQP